MGQRAALFDDIVDDPILLRGHIKRGMARVAAGIDHRVLPVHHGDGDIVINADGVKSGIKHIFGEVLKACTPCRCCQRTAARLTPLLAL